MPVDLDKLQKWYRKAMLRRIEELRALRDGLEEGDRATFREARAIGRALRGSGGAFGFEALSEQAEVLEMSTDEEIFRRVEGLIGSLWALVEGGTPSRPIRWEWLFDSAGVPHQELPPGGFFDLVTAWREAAERGRMTQETLASRVTQRLGLSEPDPEDVGAAAFRLLPEALMRGEHLVPVREDARTITVVAADPTSLATELEIARITGRIPLMAVAPPELIDTAVAAHIARRPSIELTRVLHSSEAPAAPSEGYVLVADSDEAVRRSMKDSLERHGFGVIEAADGLEALAAIRDARHPVRMAVVDLEMPNLPGRDLLGRLGDEDARSKVPVIVVSGHDELLLQLDVMDDGAEDYIRKPFDPRFLVSRVRAALERGQA